MGRCYLNSSKTSKTPRRPFEKERIDNELQIIGKYGLKNKREVWRVQLVLAKLRKAARELLTLDPKDPKRLFEGSALMRRMFRFGLLGEGENKLDYILGLTTQKLLERRLQTVVCRSLLAKSIHHARVLIRHKHIKVGKNLVNIPSFMVRVESEKTIDKCNEGKIGRTKRKNLARKGKEE